MNHAGHARDEHAVNTGHDMHVGHAGHQQQMEHGDHSGHAGHAGHGGHEGHAEVYRRLFWINLLLALPVVFYSEMVQDWFGYTAPEFPGSDQVAPVLGTIIFLYGGSVFLQGAWDELRNRKPGMMMLISLAITVAFVASLLTTFGFFSLDFWWELALLIVIMLLGHWQEMRAVGQAQSALGALAALLPDDAERVVDGNIETVPVSELTVGDVVLVRPGARVPADGEIIDGQAELDESMITGESRAVEKGRGDKVVAGTVVAGSALRVRVESVGDDTALAGIQRLVEEAERSGSRAQALADRFAAALFYVAVGAGIITFIVWAAIGETGDAVVRTVTVLVISCPHALGLAIPLVISISTSLSSRQGVLIRNRLALERMRTIDTVLFDKTGTLTRGNHAVTDVASIDDGDRQLLSVAAAVEAVSEHPLAKAIVSAARERSAPQRQATDFQAIAGRGVAGMVDGARISVGGPAMLRERDLTVPAELRARTDEWAGRGAGVVFVARDDEVIGAFALEDQIRPESRAAVNELHERGVRVVMITGDAQQVADAVAAELGIDEVFAEVLPEDKASAVAELQQRGEKVAMVGDGVNDAPALAGADVGIAIGAGTDVAIESAGVILASNDPRSVTSVIRLSEASYRKMVQNLIWAVGYNVIAIPLAAGVLEPWGIVMPPAVAAILMSVSTIVVALNAQTLRGLDLRPETHDERSPRRATLQPAS